MESPTIFSGPGPSPDTVQCTRRLAVQSLIHRRGAFLHESSRYTLYYYRARYYSPTLGRFLQTDPVGYKDDIDLYTYVGNDPLDKTDPSGNEGVLGSIANALDYADEEYFTPLGPFGGIEEHLVEVPVVAGLRAADAAISGARAASVEAKAVKAEASAAERATTEAAGSLPKPPTGAGSVPRSARDPQRFFTPEAREAKRAEQGNKCANGCGTKIDESNSAGHHIKRHAEGGKTVPENHAEVCNPCHKDLHSGSDQ